MLVDITKEVFIYVINVEDTEQAVEDTEQATQNGCRFSLYLPPRL